MASHKDLIGQNIHTPITWEVADEAERLALSVSSIDLHKIAFQEDTKEGWILTGHSPVEWKALFGAPGPAGSDGAPGVGIPTGGVTGDVLVKKSGTDFDFEWSSILGDVDSALDEILGE